MPIYGEVGTDSRKSTVGVAKVGSYDWLIDGYNYNAASNAEINARQLTITLEGVLANTDKRYLQRLRDVGKNAGKQTVVESSDGGWSVIDRSETGNTVEVTPPAEWQPYFVRDTYYVGSYSESHLGGSRYSVSFTFIRSGPREPEDPANVLDQGSTASNWTLQFEHGRLDLPEKQVQLTNQSGKDSIELELLLDLDEAEVVDESASYINGYTPRNVLDGDTYYVDNSVDTSQTVTVTAPTDKQSYVPNQDYVIESWSIESASPSKLRAKLTIYPEGK